jgi:predicted HicB family RNase H-like nuclease
MRRQRRHTGCTAQISVKLPPALKASLKARAEAQGITLGRLVVETLQHHIRAAREEMRR